MGESALPVSACRVCGRGDWLDVLSYGHLPVANGFLDQAERGLDEPRYPLDVVVCRGCWLMSLRHVVAPEVLFRHYLYVSSDSEQLSRHMRELTRDCVDRFQIEAGSLVLELGSNVGSQLQRFRAAGMRVLGVDPAKNLAELADQRGIETVPEFFTAALATQIRLERGPARLVLARHVLAHIDDLSNVLRGVRTLLSTDGAFVVEVPYLLDLLDGVQLDTIYHEHLSYFSLLTLAMLFARHGLRVVHARRTGVHGGSIVVSAVPEGSTRAPDPAIATLCAAEELAGLTAEETYRRFAARARHQSDAIGALVRRLGAAGARVAGYGAPAKGTTLLNVTGLTSDDIAFCSDTTALKHDKLLPGTHIPVWPPHRARRAAPDYYLLLAWNYADEILRRERAYLAAGGRFIVPIPRLSVVSATTTTFVACTDPHRTAAATVTLRGEN